MFGEDVEEEEAFIDFRLPDDAPELATKLDENIAATDVRLWFEYEAPQDELLKACRLMGQKLEKLTTLNILMTDDSGPIILPIAELLHLRKDTLERVDVWLTEAVSGTQKDHDYFFQQIQALTKVKSMALFRPYEWVITNSSKDSAEQLNWIMESYLASLNNLATLQDISFHEFPITQTKALESALLKFCGSGDGRPGIKLEIYGECDLSTSFTTQVCGHGSRVAELTLTGISNINDSGPPMVTSLQKSSGLKSLAVRRLPGSTFTSSDLSDQTAASIVGCLKDNTTLEALEISIKLSNLDSPATKSFLDALRDLQHLTTLTIQLNTNSYDMLWSGVDAVLHSIGSPKALQIKARVNKEQGEKSVPALDEANKKRYGDELKKKFQTALEQNDSLQEISIEGVISQKVCR